MRRIYLASSWRNQLFDAKLKLLRDAGHRVYNFKNPEAHFGWHQTDMGKNPSAFHQRETLTKHPNASHGFIRDFRAMLWADTCVLLLPCGRSAHLELGYCAGMGKHAIIYLQDGEEPDLMNLLANDMVINDDELLKVLQ